MKTEKEYKKALDRMAEISAKVKSGENLTKAEQKEVARLLEDTADYELKQLKKN